MNTIMSHKEWMKETKGNFTKPRSPQLKAVDQALAKYEQSKNKINQDAVTKALIAWQMFKGNAWKTSPRNKTNAVENLFKQLNGLGTKANVVALSHIRDESRALLTDLFQHKQLVFKPGLLTKIAGNKKTFGIQVSKAKVIKSTTKVVKNSYTLAKTSSSSSSSSNSPDVKQKANALAQKLMNEFIPSDVYQDVIKSMAQVMPNFLTELQASCAPFVGVVFSGGSAVYSGCKLAQAAYKQDRAKMHVERTLSAQEPEAAFKALIIMIERETHQKAEKFAKGLADFGSKLASTLADGGTATNAAIGLASGMIKLLMILRVVVRDIQERNAANKLLREPTITIKLFEANPLMGSYFICCAPTSVLVNVMLDSENFNQPGMMDKVERAVKRHIKPLKSRARSLINDHRMYIPELQNHPGVLKKNKKKLKEMMEQSGKSSMVGIGPDDFDDDSPSVG